MDKSCVRGVEKEMPCRPPIYIYKKNIRGKTEAVVKLIREVLLVTWVEFIVPGMDSRADRATHFRVGGHLK